MTETEYSISERTQRMSEGEYRNMQGRLHTTTTTFTGVADGATNYVSIQTGSKPVKIFSASNGSGGYFYRLYEDQGGMDVTFDGAVEEPEPTNRAEKGYSFEPGFEIQKNPTVTSPGTEIVEEYSSGTSGKNDAKQAAPGVVDADRSLILAPNTDYLVEIEDNTADSTTSVYNFDLNYWEMTYNV